MREMIHVAESGLAERPHHVATVARRAAREAEVGAALRVEVSARADQSVGFIGQGMALLLGSPGGRACSGWRMSRVEGSFIERPLVDRVEGVPGSVPRRITRPLETKELVAVLANHLAPALR